MMLPLEIFSALITPTSAEGVLLARRLVDELTLAWDSAQPPAAEPAESLRNTHPPRPDPAALLAVQFSLIAAANNYWR